MKNKIIPPTAREIETIMQIIRTYPLFDDESEDPDDKSFNESLIDIRQKLKNKHLVIVFTDKQSEVKQ